VDVDRGARARAARHRARPGLAVPAAAFLGVLVGGTALLGWLATRTFTARVLT
jgi:hypothetical protein